MGKKYYMLLIILPGTIAPKGHIVTGVIPELIPIHMADSTTGMPQPIIKFVQQVGMFHQERKWETLMNNSGGEIAAGGILKEMGTEHWLEPNRDATNQYGFTALPAGYRASYENRFDPIGISANFWTSTEFSDVGAWFYGMYFSFGSMGTNSNLKSEGLSIRCIKN